MASTSNNILTRNYRGKVARQYSLRTRGDISIIAGLPKPREAGSAPSDAVIQARKRFQLAAIYARKSNDNPELMAEYAKSRRGNQTAFNVAFLDAYRAPEISGLRTDGYKGEPGQALVIQAIDNFRVTSVRFTLTSADGSVLEEGEATNLGNGYDWLYTAKAENASLPGTAIRVTAEDIPMNKTVFEAVL